MLEYCGAVLRCVGCCTKKGLRHLVLLLCLWGAGPLVCRVQQSLQMGCIHCGHLCAQNLHAHHIRCHHVYRCRAPLLGNLQSWD